MPKKPKPEPDNKEQSQRFVENARQREADKSGKSFESALNTVIKSDNKIPDRLNKRVIK